MSITLSNSFFKTNQPDSYLRRDSADFHFIFPSTESTSSTLTQTVPAHKCLLEKASQKFIDQLKEKNTVEIVDSNANTFKELLQFIYLPEVTLTIKNIEEVVRLAKKYGMLECFDMGIEFLQTILTIENVVIAYQLAISLEKRDLMEHCEKFIQIHTNEILYSDMFLHCSGTVIRHIVELDTLACDEIELFNGCLKWAKSSC